MQSMAARVTIRFLALGLCFGLGACFQASGGEWFKPGVESGATTRALSQCQTEARALGREEGKIDQDITASRGSDWQMTGSYGANTSQMADSNAKRQATYVDRCMKAKGFTQPAAK